MDVTQRRREISPNSTRGWGGAKESRVASVRAGYVSEFGIGPCLRFLPCNVLNAIKDRQEELKHAQISRQVPLDLPDNLMETDTERSSADSSSSLTDSVILIVSVMRSSRIYGDRRPRLCQSKQADEKDMDDSQAVRISCDGGRVLWAYHIKFGTRAFWNAEYKPLTWLDNLTDFHHFSMMIASSFPPTPLPATPSELSLFHMPPFSPLLPTSIQC
ncbi:uncharacterized protein ARMOST_18788 [Armillaria ostoyae]|uniref:Uncharacterized protein n=1 Tax=Armillaria ostoyae TaxID=47428 RepID=A0A284S2S3_ARMOS|nr:uncharacterized protein ARMOST_18788 [Armillaria ostoyae]